MKECIEFQEIENVTFTSNGVGTLQGNGAAWWGYASYLRIDENRPRLFRINSSKQMLIENLQFINSPYWTTLFEDVEDLEIRYSAIDVRRNPVDWHDLYNIADFNTDGFDVSGRNVHIHHVDIWCDDDTIVVKGRSGNNGIKCSENMLFEHVKASGVGLTIGSIGASDAHTCVRNITFRHAVMHHTFKGIYMKSRPSGASATGEITRPGEFFEYLGFLHTQSFSKRF